MQFAGKTIVVTGGCGYLGSQLIRDLTTRIKGDPPHIRIVDNLHGGQVRALMELPSTGHYQFIEGDIMDPSVLRLALEGADVVIHLAAIVRSPMNFDDPTWLAQVNQWGTAHLVEAALTADVKHLIFTSSVAVYGPGGPFAENDACRPQGPYAQSKRTAEEYVLKANARGLRSTVLRLGMIYGMAPVMRFEAVANRLAYLAGVQRPLTVYGDGQQIRPFLHVRDASSALLHVLQTPSHDDERLFNVASDNVSILDLVDTIKTVHPQVGVRYSEQDIRTHYSFAMRTEAFRNFGWQPSVALESGLDEIITRFSGLTQSRPDMPDMDIV